MALHFYLVFSRIVLSKRKLNLSADMFERVNQKILVRPYFDIGYNYHLVNLLKIARSYHHRWPNF